MGKFVSRDVNTRSEQELFKWKTSDILRWDVKCCKISDRGHLVYVVVQLFNITYSPRKGRMCVLDLPMYTVQLTNSTYRTLFEFLADDNSGKLTGPIIFDVPDHASRVTSLHVENGDTSFLHISQSLGLLAETVVFDTRNCTFYEFPELPGISDPVRWCYALQRKTPLYS